MNYWILVEEDIVVRPRSAKSANAQLHRWMQAHAEPGFTQDRPRA